MGPPLLWPYSGPDRHWFGEAEQNKARSWAMTFSQGRMVSCAPIYPESLRCRKLPSVWTGLRLRAVNQKKETPMTTDRRLSIRLTLLVLLLIALTFASSRLQADTGTCGG